MPRQFSLFALFRLVVVVAVVMSAASLALMGNGRGAAGMILAAEAVALVQAIRRRKIWTIWN